MGKVSFRPLFCVSSLIIIAALASCSQAKPRIIGVSLKLVYRQMGAAPVERLSCFVFAEDDDGDADLEELRLVNDRSQLYWTLTSSDWITVVKTGQTWFGSHAISMPEGMKFPRGSYRLVLVDKGGERDERALSFDAPSKSERPFPALAFSSGSYAVSSAYPKNLLIAYGASGAVLRTLELTEKEGKLADLSLGPNVVTVALWAEDEAGSVAAFTDPIPIK